MKHRGARVAESALPCILSRVLSAPCGSIRDGAQTHMRMQEGSRLVVSCVERLPSEILLCIFIEAIMSEGGSFRLVTTLSLVCRRWHSVCQHATVWSLMAKRTFVAYPLVMRLLPTSQPSTTGCEPLGAGEGCSAAWDVGLALRPPTPSILRQVAETVERHNASWRYYRYVQRRRDIVLHSFLSVSLLSLSISMTLAMFAAEGLHVEELCTTSSVFFFLWVSYISAAGVVVSNVVIQVHFWPQPLLGRLRRSRSLIITSTVGMLLSIYDFVVPTILVEINLKREKRYPWVWCGATIILSLCVWQCYILVRIMPDARAQLRRQLAHAHLREGLRFVIVNVPNAFPMLFAAGVFCVLQRGQYGERLYMLLCGIPVVVSLAVLSLVFVLDYFLLRRAEDLSVGVCLFFAMLFPLSLFFVDFRGWCLLPLVTASFGFFVLHGRFMFGRALRELLDRCEDDLW